MNTSNSLFKIFLVVLICTTSYLLNAQNGQNILTNGGFESNPPSNMGNNIGHSVAPWTLGSGQSSNVVRIDGPGGYNYSNNGPQSDASGVTNSPRHYLDITNGSNNFYQSFTPQCSGKVTVGGYFSTRANGQGTGYIEIRQGNGLTGPVVGQTVPVTLPGGNSMTDAWTPVSKQVSIQENVTYSFIVSMDNNMNFDEGFVKYDFNCGGEPPSTEFEECDCIPKSLYTDQLTSSLFEISNVSGPINNFTYNLIYKPTSSFAAQNRAWNNWINAKYGPLGIKIVHQYMLYEYTGSGSNINETLLEEFWGSNPYTPHNGTNFKTKLNRNKKYYIKHGVYYESKVNKNHELIKNCPWQESRYYIYAATGGDPILNVADSKGKTLRKIRTNKLRSNNRRR